MMRTMHLFAGGGGGMYADLILGHNPTVAVEWEKSACDVLRARKKEWWPDCEIIEGDIRAFSGVEYAGKVDCIHAGFPCQDLSVAGKRAGLDGDRSSLYVEALRIFREVRPRYLFLENVTGITSANGGEALNRVMSDLAEIGLDARWTCLRASDVGANHRRDRWWCLAYAKRPERGAVNEVGSVEGQYGLQPEDGRQGSGRLGEQGEDVSNPQRDPLRDEPGRRSGENRKGKTEFADNGDQGYVADADGLRLKGECRSGEKEIAKHGEDVADSPRHVRERCRCGSESEWNAEYTNPGWWDTEPSLGRVANGVAQRVNRLKMLGNGQVPLQAAYAWVMLGGPTEVNLCPE